MRTARQRYEDSVGVAILSIDSQIQENQDVIAKNRAFVAANKEMIKKTNALIRKLRSKSSN